MVALGGVMVSPVRTAAVTFKLALALCPFNMAVTVVLPSVTPVATPAVLMLATVGVLLLQATKLVTSNVEPSL